MISKSQQNMAILDEEIKFSQAMNEMPKNLSLDKINCDKPSSITPKAENLLNDLSENSKNNSDNNEIKTNEFQSETRIQLSFSVDRLLSNKLQQIKKSPPPPPSSQTDTHSHDPRSDKCCDELNSSYACCSLPNCLVNSTTTVSTSLSFQGNSYPPIDEELTTGSNANFMDYKSVVRPTPMRPMSNSSETVPSLTHFSSLPPTSLIRFHHAHMQQQKQLTQHLPAQSNFTLSSLMNPLCGLKPLQMNVQQMGLQNFSTTTSNRFNTKMNFDIPVVRPNLSCISTLRHHHMGTTNSNESHMNFNSNTTAPATSNTATTNTNAGNSHANISSGKRKRSWSRAVFSNLQRKGLEIQFQQQKYITKPDRRKLAARLNLTDAQVKVWFQNRRMKWRHTRENLKSGQEKQPGESVTADTLKANVDNAIGNDLPGYSSDGSSSLEMSDVEDDDDEIDVVE
ncbi:homeobox protein H2.0 [Lucilia sericata]|uniref:homeobox protein H2.0 n=1 Tax=Lucilia sericata TaxID=13632 RepID=UPI0018A81D59|nr:homeobox protein H2.0 [Lucilia sericata]